MKRKLWLLILCVSAISAALVFHSCARRGPTSALQIGAVIPLTGPSAQYGKFQMQGMNLAQQQISQVEKFDIKIDYQDSTSDPKTGVLAFRALSNGGDLCVITGVSGVVLAIAPAAQELQFPQINTSGQNSKIGESGPFTVSLINLADVETSSMAQYAYEVMGLRKVALIYSNAAAGTGAADQFKTSFAKLGGNIVADESYDDNQTDYRGQIERAFVAKPEAIFAPGVSVNISRVMRQAFELSHKTQWLSYSAFEGPEVEKVAGAAAAGTIFTSTGLDPNQDSEFIRQYKQSYGSDPELYAATAYDAVRVLYQAYKSGIRTRKELADFLTSGQFSYSGVTGTFRIEKNGTVKKPVVFKVFQEGKFQLAPKQLPSS